MASARERGMSEMTCRDRSDVSWLSGSFGRDDLFGGRILVLNTKKTSLWPDRSGVGFAVRDQSQEKEEYRLILRKT